VQLCTQKYITSLTPLYLPLIPIQELWWCWGYVHCVSLFKVFD